MQFFAGILFAWSLVHVVMVPFMVLVYFRYNRNRDYLIFSAGCVVLVVFFLAKAARYLATSAQGIDIPMRLEGATIPLGATILFSIAQGRVTIKAITRKYIVGSFGLLSVLLAIVNLLGLSFDATQPFVRHFAFFYGDALLYEYGFTIWGYIGFLVALGLATGSGVLLGKSVENDAVERNFYWLGVVVLNLLALHDFLLIANVIKSVYLVEHGLFVMNLCVLFGFVREVEISRERLLDRTQALREASISLEQAANETRRLRPMADLGRLSASLAHEIRNPLAVLSNVASSLRHHSSNESDPKKIVPLITMMQEETDRLARLVDDLLLFSQTSRPSKDSVDIASLVSVALADVTRFYDPSMTPEIVTTAEGNLPLIIGNQNNLRRALTNLIANSFQSSQGRGTVQVIARRDAQDSDTVMIGVVDNAGGVPVEHQSEIFDPFFSTRPTGTGLGLPIAKSIAEAHFGTLVFENRPGEGASFWLRLPTTKPKEKPE
jgi:signal transduction histidine kinase